MLKYLPFQYITPDLPDNISNQIAKITPFPGLSGTGWDWMYMMNDEMNEDRQFESNDRYIVHINNFDGPLDLLWSLIRKAEIDITEVSISEITEQYINYLKVMESLNIHVASEFIQMASELLYYKSKALIPGEEVEDEFFIAPLPPELVQKLLEYKKYQNAAVKLGEEFSRQNDYFPRQNKPAALEEDEQIIQVSLFDLLNAFADVMEAVKLPEQQEIIFDEILVSERIMFISRLLLNREQIAFSELFEKDPGRAQIVATFLAILEMSKGGNVRLLQYREYGDIRILKTESLN